jgi:penicillin amidase
MRTHVSRTTLRLAISLVALAGSASAVHAQAAAGTLDQLATRSLSKIAGTVSTPGLKAPVEVLRDKWGVPHIYAKNLDDLFFAQGFVQAQDRLWQLEMWRRVGDGTLAEVIGPSAVARDRQARLLMYRGAFDEAEFTSYHPEGRRILDAFARGVNAFIDASANNLPVEFKLTGIKPQKWTARTPLLRRTTIGAALGELRAARSVAELGIEEWNRRNRPTPYRVLTVPKGLDLSVITPAVIAAATAGADPSAARGAMPAPALLSQYTAITGGGASPDAGGFENSPGSNNWVISGSKTKSGKVILAGDPHRQVTNPSLRYLVHLNAPGWTATGATEPMLPGVMVGHNANVAWALTIVGTDQGDVFVNEVNPANRNQVRWKGAWEDLRVVTDTIRVKGAAPQIVQLKFSRHGPVFYEDTVRHVNFAYRAVDNEPGSAGYLGALSFNQSKNCKDFLNEAAKRYKAPTENLVCGDDAGNIGWIPAALSPKRSGGWDGRLPVPGTGEFQWDGFRADLPREYNPARGFIATANHDIHPAGFDPPLFFKTGDFWRFERLSALLSAGTAFTIDDFLRMQHDTYYGPAAVAQAFARGWTGRTPEVEQARVLVADWDRHFDRSSVAAAVYDAWNRRLTARGVTADTPKAVRDSLAQLAMREALDTLSTTNSMPWTKVNWGKVNRSEFPHSLVKAYDIPAIERRGAAGTVAAFGATVRYVIDFADFDRTMQTNTPGQSGQPGSPFYGNLTEMYGNATYFPQPWTRKAVDAVVAHRLVLSPGSGK